MPTRHVLVSVNGHPVHPGMTLSQSQTCEVLKAHVNQVFDLMNQFQHVNELDPVTRELFRDLRGTLNGKFMLGVG